jgi:hypothetical protein
VTVFDGPTGRTGFEAAALPAPRGPLSECVLAALRDEAPPRDPPPVLEPYGEDAQLTLYCLYELHYRGFAGADAEREWDLDLLRVRRALERAFLAALRADVPAGHDVEREIAGLLTEPVDAEGTGVSHHLLRAGEAWQLREYLAHRSLYHLKEADPQAWVIPRLPASAKAALVTVEHDEYGAGDPERVHAQLFAAMLRCTGLDDGYGAYVDWAPAPTLAEVNLMSLCGLHRALRGALVGQFATVELTSSPGSDRLVRAMHRMGFTPTASAFYAEHIEADAVHEQLMRHGVLQPLLAAEPELAQDVVFGIRASTLLADRFENQLLTAWSANRTSLRHALPPT